MSRGQAICPKLLFFLERFLLFVRNPRLSTHARLHRNQFSQCACGRGQIEGLVVRCLINDKKNNVILIRHGNVEPLHHGPCSHNILLYRTLFFFGKAQQCRNVGRQLCRHAFSRGCVRGPGKPPLGLRTRRMLGLPHSRRQDHHSQNENRQQTTRTSFVNL